MNPTIRNPAARLALTLGLAVGAWLILAAATPSVETFSPAGAATVAAEPDRIHLAQADAVPVESPVSYSSDQADRGQDRFERDCEECHGDDLRGGLVGGPPLRGLNFEQKFANGAPASALYMFMSTMMPPGRAGRYGPDTYADLMAYILKRNGFGAGASLPSDVDALNYLIMEK